jgi:hypothetical protein
MSNEHNDPFRENDGFDDFGAGDENGFFEDDRSADGDNSNLHDEFADDAEPAPLSKESVKATKQESIKKGVSGTSEPKSFIKTPLGIASVALGAVSFALVGFVGYKGLSSTFGNPASSQIDVVDAVVPQASEPAIGNATGLIKSHTSAPVAQGAETALTAPKVAPTPVESVSPPMTVDTVEALKESIIVLQEQTSDIREILRTVNKSLEREEVAHNALMASINEIKNELAKQTQAQTPVVIAPSAPAVTVTAGQPAVVRQVETISRQRLPGLQVIETSQGGAMSIIKKSDTGRVFTLFKGEVINLGGVKSQVTSIEKDGDLVLVGDKYFIDKVLEAQKAPQKTAEAPATERKVSVTHEAKSAREAKPVREPKLASTVVKTANGYTLNAVYNGKSAFGIVNNKGDFKSYKIGDTIDDLGAVIGLDDAGNLKVGGTVIKPVY